MEKPRISFFTDRLYIRSVEKSDKDKYMNLRETTSPLASVYKSLPGFRDHEWEGELNSPNDIYVAAFLKDTLELVAIASFQNYDTDTIEFGFDVSESYRNQGIATELIRGMVQTAHTFFPGKTFVIRTDMTNAACRRVAEKCGGILTECEPTLAAKVIANFIKLYDYKSTDDPALIQRRKKNAEFIEENKEGVCIYRLE